MNPFINHFVPVVPICSTLDVLYNLLHAEGVKDCLCVVCLSAVNFGVPFIVLFAPCQCFSNIFRLSVCKYVCDTALLM